VQQNPMAMRCLVYDYENKKLAQRERKKSRNYNEVCYTIINIPVTPLYNAHLWRVFSFIIMKYNKPPLTYDEQLNLLLSRGLQVKDKEAARDLLKRISYYRLTAYCIPFQKEKDSFKTDVAFDDVYKLYVFDHQLRMLVLDVLETLEVALRSLITYHLSHAYGAFGYLKADNFSNNFQHDIWLIDVEREISRSREVFITHYKEKYKRSAEHFPLWMATEVFSFGSLSRLFAGLKTEDKHEIAMIFEIHSSVLQSWLHTLVYIRNICAHHGRLWNKTLAIKPKIPKKDTRWDCATNAKVGSVLMLINYCLDRLKSDYDFKNRLKTLFSAHSFIDIQAMGLQKNRDSLF
jgi:abortive infection bacteriophage resistance protein